MAGVPPFLDEPTDTREAIMRATFRALARHGYADLTIQRIGDEFEKSKSLLYHHYDGKDDLLLEFLEFLLDRFAETVPETGAIDDPAAHLERLLDWMLPVDPAPGAEDFVRALVELRAQAAHDPAYRDHFTRSDRLIRDRLADVIRAGVESGAFRPVDPEATAACLLTLLGGAMTQRVTADEFPAAAVRAAVDTYVDERLLAGGA